MKLSLLAALVAAAVPALPARAAEPAIIAKARAYLGPEAALNGVRTIHFIGRVAQRPAGQSGALSKDAGNRIDYYFERPWRERIAVSGGGAMVETALDDFDGWQRTTPPAGGGGPRLVLLGAAVTENLRADTWENLNFYRGLELAGGTVEDEGLVMVGGIACEKVVFTHSPASIYRRYFDLSTGRLVFTETAAGVIITERGEINAGGIRFPAAIETRQPTANGGAQVTVYSFDRIIVNEALPDSLFTMPLATAAP